ncbi:MAG: hypothetical protein BGO78_17275 [Chloroflexi bacterium 44-23]|nr:MAG: hypothetical protein BGO78_17275 [Chloroflexi bacterium 44-23]
MDNNSGFRELSHTADAALKIWAPSLQKLFSTALIGMYQLMGLSSNCEEQGESQLIELEEIDSESLLIAFLSECLYYVESKGMVLKPTSITILDNHLTSICEVNPLISLEKEIKAVTFHNLAIENVNQKWEVTVVFDL